MKKKQICGITVAIVFLAIGLFSLFGLPSIVDNAILDGVVLDPNTYDVWGANPGSTNTLTLRNFTFFNITNPRGFLYRNEKPRFHEITNYLYQQRSNFTDLRYSQDRSVIDFNFWLYFTILEESRDVNQTVTVLNLAPLGFWSQLDTVDISALAIQGFGGLFVELNRTIKMQAIGQGVAGQFLSSRTNWTPLCQKYMLTPRFCDILWSDPIHGLSDQNNYEIWVDWAYYGNQDSELVLYEYFGFDRTQIRLIGQTLKQWCRAVDSILNNWYCGGSQCKNYDLAILQLSSAGLTARPPSGEAADSICLSGNITCQGYPQLFSFYKYEFPKINNDSSFQGLNFSIETTSNLFSPYNGTLLNVGNLSHLFQIGQAFDKDLSNTTLIEQLIRITHSESDKHAVVIWEYAKYFTYEFVLKTKQNGVRKIAGLAGVFTSALYQSFIQFSEWFLKQQLSLLVAQSMPDCIQFMNRTVQDLDSQTLNWLCDDVNPQNYTNYFRLIEPMHNEFHLDKFQSDYNLSHYNMQQISDKVQQSMFSLVQQAHLKIYSKYHCNASTQEYRCTAFQLGIKQFINSEITLNPIQNTIKNYPPSSSAHSWNPELQEWEYRHFLKEVYGDTGFDTQNFSDYNRLADLLSFDKLFSVPKVQDLLLTTNDTQFQTLFYWKNKTLLVQYIRFVTVEVGFGGFTQKRTVNELLFGYEDAFLKTLKEMDPMLGGDPSIVTLVALNQPNSTLQEAKFKPQSMYTGYSDPLLTRVYLTNMEKEYVTYNRSFYDGYSVQTQLKSPYIQKLKLFGTDAVQNKPMCPQGDYQYIYIDTLYRIGQLKLDRQQERFGFKINRYTITPRFLASAQEYPPNANYHQSISGFMNLSFLGIPLFSAKNHFLDVKGDWPDLVEMYDESGTYLQKASEYDQTEVVMEPKTGASFTATIYLQNNIYLDQDILFPRRPHMLPVFTLYRSGNLTQSAAADVLSDLKTALAAPTKVALACLVGFVLSIVSICACRMNVNHRRIVPDSLLESYNEHDPDEVEKVMSKEPKKRASYNSQISEERSNESVQREVIEESAIQDESDRYESKIPAQINHNANKKTTITSEIPEEEERVESKAESQIQEEDNAEEERDAVEERQREEEEGEQLDAVKEGEIRDAEQEQAEGQANKEMENAEEKEAQNQNEEEAP